MFRTVSLKNPCALTLKIAASGRLPLSSDCAQFLPLGAMSHHLAVDCQLVSQVSEVTTGFRLSSLSSVLPHLVPTKGRETLGSTQMT